MKSNARASMGFAMSDTNLGAELKKLRGERSLRDVAAMTGINYATLSRIENNQIELPTRETLAALSRAYRTPLEQLAQLAYCGTSTRRHPAPATPPSMKEPALAS